jgi:L-2-hydroxyglutarate oxidase LhgO
VNCDILIIGGGIIGASCAYFIKSLVKDMSVVVLERDSKVCIRLISIILVILQTTY